MRCGVQELSTDLDLYWPTYANGCDENTLSSNNRSLAVTVGAFFANHTSRKTSKQLIQDAIHNLIAVR
jgi:hypothetical protein